jgi:lysyl-tRNA synthetase class 2
MPDIESAAIGTIDYDELGAELVVLFKSGRRYVYYGVPREVYQDFLDAESQGRYFNAHIKDRYRYTEI